MITHSSDFYSKRDGFNEKDAGLKSITGDVMGLGTAKQFEIV